MNTAATHAGPRSNRRVLMLLLAPSFLLAVVLGIALLYLFLYSFGERGERLLEAFTLDSWRRVISDAFFWQTLFNTIQLAATVTIATLVLGYPTAYALSHLHRRRVRAIALVIVFSPLVVSVVVRSYGWLLLLGDSGLVNYLLQLSGLIHEPVRLIFNLTGVQIGLVHALVPLMVFPILAGLDQVSGTLREAAMDLGAGRIQTFRRVTLPLTLPAMIAGSQIVFTLALGALVTPVVLGGGRVQVISQQIYQNVQFFDWPRAAIQTSTLLVVTMLILLASLLVTRRSLGAVSRASS